MADASRDEALMTSVTLVAAMGTTRRGESVVVVMLLLTRPGSRFRVPRPSSPGPSLQASSRFTPSGRSLLDYSRRIN
jgi:hypothetical protein